MGNELCIGQPGQDLGTFSRGKLMRAAMKMDWPRVDNLQTPGSFSQDGKLFTFTDVDPVTGWDIWMLGTDREPEPLLKTRYGEWNPHLSPDGRWLAYESDESGRV